MASSNWTAEWLVPSQDSSSLRKCLIWLEMSAGTIAVTAFAINGFVMASAKVYNASCRAYFFGLLNLAFAQCLLSLTSLAGVIYSLWLLDYTAPRSTHKDGWWCSVLHNVIHAIHLLSMSGTAALSLSHWWSLNISVNHAQMATGYRIVKTVFCVLWFLTLVFAAWLNFLVVFLGAGLTSTMAENERRAIQPCLRIYSLTLVTSASLLFFSNLSSIPPVTGHLTTRAIENNHQQDCQDADCFCSDSSDYDTPAKTLPNIALKLPLQSRQVLDTHPLKIIVIPTIVTLHEYDHVVKNATETFNNDNELVHSDHANNSQPCRYEVNQLSNQLSSQANNETLPSPASPACNASVYSADLSTNSVHDATAENKLSTEKLHNRLQQLNNARLAFSHDADSRSQSSYANSRRNSKPRKKRPMKRRKKFKKYPGLKQIQWECPTRIQITVMLSFVIFYVPPWFLLVVGIHMPEYATIFMSIFRLLINVGSSLNPVLQGFRHPRFALKMVRTWRKIYPTNVNFSKDSSVDFERVTKTRKERKLGVNQ